jgi:hypothetical protein
MGSQSKVEEIRILPDKRGGLCVKTVTRPGGVYLT